MIRTELVKEGIVVKVHGEKHNFTVEDLNRVLLISWTEDDISSIPERYRMQLTFLLHVYSWTGVRLDALFMRGLCYKTCLGSPSRTVSLAWNRISTWVYSERKTTTGD